MKGKAQLEWLQLLQLNKCGWMIISFPPRNKKEKGRQRWIITQSKTIELDFEVAALPNLKNTSAAEMVFWAQPTGAVGPLRHGPRGRAYLFQWRRCCFWVCRGRWCVCSHPQRDPVKDPSLDPVPASKPAESPRARTSFANSRFLCKYTGNKWNKTLLPHSKI